MFNGTMFQTEGMFIDQSIEAVCVQPHNGYQFFIGVFLWKKIVENGLLCYKI